MRTFLLGLVGLRVTLFCASCIYTGTLSSVNDSCVKLSDVSIVFATGSFQNESWQDSQKLPNDWYVQCDMIESFGVLDLVAEHQS